MSTHPDLSDFIEDQDERVIEQAARALYNEWRHQYPGPVEGTSCFPVWPAYDEKRKEFWRRTVRAAYRAADRAWAETMEQHAP